MSEKSYPFQANNFILERIFKNIVIFISFSLYNFD